MGNEITNKRLSLRDLQRLAFECEDALEENGGELTPELEQALATTEAEIPQKVDSYKGLIDAMNAKADLLDREAKELATKKKAMKNAVSRVKEYILDVMKEFGLSKIKGNAYTASVRQTTAVSVDDEDEALAKYRAEVEALHLPAWVKVTLAVDKTALKDAFGGTDVMPAGTSLKTNWSLTIR